ncbi:hypothetical protein Bbelb_404330 [Branchiostoma belcheri]|nr:hypothetical protein Bbelb_404330 [Branchiostoma belcheri]
MLGLVPNRRLKGRLRIGGPIGGLLQGVAQNATCDRAETACSCTMSDGSGTINLQYVETGKPTYKDQVAQVQKDDYLYSWNPCTPFSEGPSGDQDSCTDMAVKDFAGRDGFRASRDRLSPASPLAAKPSLAGITALRRNTSFADMACQISKDQSNFFGLGTHDSAQFAADTDPDSGGLVVSVVYQAASSGRASEVLLKCTTGATVFTVLGELQQGQYGPPLPTLNTRYTGEGPPLPTLNTRYIGEGPPLPTLNTRYIGEGPPLPIFQLESPCCCPGAVSGCAGGGISGGSIVLIIAASVIVVYFVGGMIVMKVVKGAQGLEIIPNSGFWTGLPGYIKEGVLFIVSPCRKSGKYKDYIATQTTDDYLYSWNPCAPFSEVGSGDPESCTNVAACQIAKDGSISYGLGTQDSASFTVTDDPNMGQTLTLVYQMPQGGRVSGVILECTQGATTFSAIGEVTVGAYSFQLSSPCACPGAGPGCAGGGLSGGSVFLIICVVLVAVYVIAGAIFMKFVKGAQGSEVIPNIAFWKSLPGYVKIQGV